MENFKKYAGSISRYRFYANILLALAILSLLVTLGTFGSIFFYPAIVLFIIGFFVDKEQSFASYPVPIFILFYWTWAYVSKLLSGDIFIVYFVMFFAIIILGPLYFAHRAQSTKVRNRLWIASFVIVWLLGMIIYGAATPL